MTSYEEVFERCREEGMFERYPRTNDGYCRSFDVTDDSREWRDLLQRTGVVVLRVLDEEQARRTEDAFWREVREQAPGSPLRCVAFSAILRNLCSRLSQLACTAAAQCIRSQHVGQ